MNYSTHIFMQCCISITGTKQSASKKCMGLFLSIHLKYRQAISLHTFIFHPNQTELVREQHFLKACMGELSLITGWYSRESFLRRVIHHIREMHSDTAREKHRLTLSVSPSACSYTLTHACRRVHTQHSLLLPLAGCVMSEHYLSCQWRCSHTSITLSKVIRVCVYVRMFQMRKRVR